MKIKPTSRRGRVTVELKRSDEPLLEKSAAASRGSSSPLRLKEILVPVDFSDFSTKALKYALAFADQFGARITLLHVVEPVVYPENYMVVPSVLEMTDNLVASARPRLDELGREQIGNRAPFDTIVRMGRAYAEIAAAARELGVDLIVIATHGYTGLKHVLLGSTAERVVRHAPCPVLTVRDPEHEFVENPAAARKP